MLHNNLIFAPLRLILSREQHSSIQRKKAAKISFLAIVLHLLKELFKTKTLRKPCEKVTPLIYLSERSFAHHVQSQKQTIEQSVESIRS